MMIGPSAPNGPPEPMAMAAEMGFRDGELGLDLAPLQQDGLDGFGNAVAADLVRTVTRHQAHDEAAGHRHGDDPWPQMSIAGQGRR